MTRASKYKEIVRSFFFANKTLICSLIFVVVFLIPSITFYWNSSSGYSFLNKGYSFLNILAVNFFVPATTIIIAGLFVFIATGIKGRFDEASRIAFRETKRKAEEGHRDSQFEIGLMYQEGRGVERDYKKAQKWYEYAAKQGDAMALYNLGFMYDVWQVGDAKNRYINAYKWYALAYIHGDEDAKGNLIYLATQDMNEKYEDIKEAQKLVIEWVKELKKQNDASVQFCLGFLYETGNNANQNYDDAVKSYLKSADQGNADAQSALGVLHVSGKGVPQDYKKALEYYEKAAEQGHGRAQLLLGRMFHEGVKGIDKDYRKAEKYYRKAAKQWHEGTMQGIWDKEAERDLTPWDKLIELAKEMIANKIDAEELVDDCIKSGYARFYDFPNRY